MKPTDAPAAEEFLFGRLSTPAGRIEEAQQERQGFFDLSLLQALDPRPAEAIRLGFRCGVDVGLRSLQVFWTSDGSLPTWNERMEAEGLTRTAEARPLPPVWDTLVWGFVQDWQVELPPLPESSVLRYAAIGVNQSGRSIPCPWPDRDRHGSPHIAAVSIDALAPPPWFQQAVIYQVFVDRFAPTPGEPFASLDLDTRLGGTLWGLIERLDDLCELGIDTLWLTPIFASPNYHGYAVSDFFQVESALGGNAAWEQLVAACRHRGLRLILDFVANHVSDQHSAFTAALSANDAPTRSWFRFRNWPQEYDCFFDQSHQPELDAEQPEVRKHLFAAAVHWLQVGCAGFRLDYAHGLSHGFWSEFRAATRAAAPESVCFGEITHTPQVIRSYTGRLDGCLDFALCDLLRTTFARGELPLSEFDRALRRHFTYFSNELVLPSFLDNHDMNRFLLAADGDVRRLKVAALVQFLLPGPPVIYYGTEIALSQNAPLGRLEEARLPMPPPEQWNRALRNFYSALIQLRREVQPQNTLWELDWMDDRSQSAAWRIDNFTLLVNRGEQREVATGAAEIQLATWAVDTAYRQAESLTLPAWSAAVLKNPAKQDP